ncbi:MAG: C1 family peptidase [Clostridia bacterium]|nr:C1 family peptidase [Clostridia bacterium]
MYEIKKERLEELKNEYMQKDIYTIARHAISKHKISDISKETRQIEFTRNHFSINLKTLPVADQKQSGRCWIFAGCNVLREKVARKYNLEKFEISQNYISFYDKLEKCNYFLTSIVNLKDIPKGDRTVDHILQNGIEDGGQWDMFVNIVNKYGVVPQYAFPETFQSSNTAEINRILNRYVRKFACEIKTISEIEEINKLQEKYMENIYRSLCSAFGVPPTRFNFEYEDKDNNYGIIKNITPKEFLEKYVEVNLDDYVSIINSPTEDKPFNHTYTVKYLGNVVEGNKVKYLNLKMDRLKELVIAQLKDEEPVWFGSDCSKDAEREDGLWDDESFDSDKLFQIDTSLSKGAMLDYRDSAMNHAMVITGVNLDEDRSTKWKIENSWGEKIAHKGYYVASDSWFDKYVYQAVVNKKYLTSEEIGYLGQEPIELEPWDPMGTLA